MSDHDSTAFFQTHTASEHVKSWIADQLADVSRRREPGAVPGQVVVRSADATPVRIRVMQYDADHVEEVEIDTPLQIQRFAEQPAVTWVNVDGIRDGKLIEDIGDAFGIHGLVLEDIANPHQRAKVESYPSHTLIFARMPEMPGGFDT